MRYKAFIENLNLGAYLLEAVCGQLPRQRALISRVALIHSDSAVMSDVLPSSWVNALGASTANGLIPPFQSVPLKERAMINDERIAILGIAGSLRKNSFNKALLDSAFELLPRDAVMETFDISSLPFFNQDLEGNPPEVVRQFKHKIEQADAILFSTPEYNFSIPGVLKNSIEWASRPRGDNSFGGKTAAMMSASTGMIGGARAQLHLRQVLVDVNVYVVTKPEVIVTFADKKFDANGKLVDPDARKFLQQLLENLVSLTRKLQRREEHP
jgi:chromate reductase